MQEFHLGHRGTMTRPNDKEKVRKFYDLVSAHFHDLWGEHLHHGYWIRGDETKERAQVQLIDHLAQIAKIRSGHSILDVGCGTGASSIYLSKKYKVEATGITISPVQVDLANNAAAREGANTNFLLMDAEAMKFEQSFDVIWSVESISHYQDIAKFFASAARLLKPNGRIALIDWFRKPNLDPAEYKRKILPIEKGMLVELGTMPEYETWMRSSNLKIIKSEILNEHCAQTWDLGLDIIKKRSLWKLAATNGAMFVDFLRAFRAMRAGFASGDFVYGLVVAQKL
jgi:cyclopropane fatty-acyl-phospholipid synthase-like methyltransferase